MKKDTVRNAEMKHALAQLRHAYSQLVAGAVTDQAKFANGLISPQIKRLEKYVDEDDK